jgi:hypothetical protein
MGCGCKERQAIGRRMVGALRAGDTSALGMHSREMARSLGHDIGGALRLRGEPPTPAVPSAAPKVLVRR